MAPAATLEKATGSAHPALPGLRLAASLDGLDRRFESARPEGAERRGAERAEARRRVVPGHGGKPDVVAVGDVKECVLVGVQKGVEEPERGEALGEKRVVDETEHPRRHGGRRGGAADDLGRQASCVGEVQTVKVSGYRAKERSGGVAGYSRVKDYSSMKETD